MEGSNNQQMKRERESEGGRERERAIEREHKMKESQQANQSETDRAGEKEMPYFNASNRSNITMINSKFPSNTKSFFI
jgi:hypothetical protein